LERLVRKKRNRFELLADLLESSRGGAKKTTMMFRSNLSFRLLNKYLDFLIQNEFLEKTDGKYYPSQRGLVYLHRFARYQRAKSDLLKTQQVIQSIMPVKGERGAGR
jgi:predicted transcriptional regulator